MMDEQNLVASINAYKSQLSQVEAALEAAGEEGSEDLVKLKQDLQELISLTEESLLSLKKSQLLSLVEKQTSDPVKFSGDACRQDNQNGFDLDSEMAAFKAAIDEDSDNKELMTTDSSVSQSSAAVTAAANCDNSDDDDDDFNLDEIIGTKCRAPHQNDWGGYSYHNCMIVSVEPLDGHTEPKVRVMFCQPTHRSMLPCPYFLEDRCRFSNDKCRYSHGNVVSVSHLREYLEPDYSKLAVDSDCLVKDTDDIWYKAKVIDIHSESQMYEVMFDSSDRRLAVNITDIIPYDSTDSSRDDSDVEVESENVQPISDEDSDDEDQLPVYLWWPNQSTSVLGEWESYTKGIGSRLMSKMGYVTGQGLGSNSQGRVEPIPIQLLPQGKSLDKIMELKEIAGDQDLYDVLKKQKNKQNKVEEKAAKSYNRSLTRHTVFDFINKKIGHKKGDIHSLVNTSRTNRHSSSSSSGPVKHITEKQLSSRTDRQLNIHILQTHEEIVRMEKEITKLREAVARNKDREPTVACQLRTKLNRMEDHLRQLQSSQSAIQSHKQSRIDKKKLTIF